MELGLGTVQFGMRYGIAHRGTQPSRDDVANVLARALELGVRLLDTAPRYAQAEAALGALGPTLGAFRIVTKTVAYGDTTSGRQRARLAVEGLHASLATLRVPNVYGLLEHEPARWLEPGGEEIHAALVGQREAGYVRKVGVSALDLDELAQLAARFPLDLVQIPISAVDQRVLDSGLLERLAEDGVEIHARSAFLQGALLADPGSLEQVQGLAGAVRAFQGLARARGLAAIQAALGFLRAIPQLAAVVVGVQDPLQLEETVRAFDTRVERAWFGGSACSDARIVDPARWSAAP